MLCKAAEANGFSCADIYEAFNGPDGLTPSGELNAADYTHPSNEGNEFISDVLADLGFAPLASLGPRLSAEGPDPLQNPNRQIAETLYLSERTAETHVQNILMKLGITSPARVGAWATRDGLVEQ
jgi:hypothetical protein